MSHPGSLVARQLTMILARLVFTVAGTALGGEESDKQFEILKQKDVRTLERDLNSRVGACPEDTWYVLAFCDAAYQAEFAPLTNTGSYRGYWRFGAESDVKYQLVRGRKAAAEAVYGFLIRTSASANKLCPGVFNNASRWQKGWRLKAFAS